MAGKFKVEVLCCILYFCRSNKRWDQELVRPDLDYHDFFHPEVGNEPGTCANPCF